MIEKEILEKLYVKENKKQREIAKILNLSQAQVSRDIRKLKIEKERKIRTDKGVVKVKRKKLPLNYKKPWTKEDEEFVIEKIGVYSYTIIAKILKRTAKSIKQKRTRLGIGDPKDVDDYVTRYYLSKQLNVDNLKVQEWADKYELKMEKKNITNGKMLTRIKIEYFWEWAKKHKELINWNKFKEGNLGVEPTWVKELRINCKNTVKYYEKWTNEEDSLLQSYYKMDIPIEQIAKNLNRTTRATKGRATVLCLRRRSERQEWNAEQKEMLKKLVKDGVSTKEIATIMNRKVKNIQNAKSVYITKLQIQA